MQSAPSVAYPVGRFSLIARLALVALASLGIASVLGMTIVWPAERAPVLPVLLAGGWIAWLWAAWQQGIASPIGTLHWDASAMGDEWKPGVGSWWWQADGCAQAEPLVRLERRLDWGAGMLVHGKIGERTRWFWVSARLAEGRWGEFRRAIEAQANPV